MSLDLKRFTSRKKDGDDEAPKPKSTRRQQQCSATPPYVAVTLDDDWGYRALTAAGKGAAILVYAISEQQRPRGPRSEVPITAAVLRRLGISRKIRTAAIAGLVNGGFVQASYRGKYRGCPLITVLHPDFGTAPNMVPKGSSRPARLVPTGP
jgi:hypothetical protein